MVKMKTGLSFDNPVYKIDENQLEHYDVYGLCSLRAIFNRELHFLILLQAAIAIHLNRREVDEHVLSTIMSNKSVALRGVEPFNGSMNTF
jgi:hypothetical protein